MKARWRIGEHKEKRGRIVQYWGYCLWCGTRENLTLDHIIPLSRGGSNEDDNLQCLCAPCNLWKGDRLEVEIEIEEAPPPVDPVIEGIINALLIATFGYV